MGFGSYDESEQGKNDADFDEDDEEDMEMDEKMKRARHQGKMKEVEGDVDTMMERLKQMKDEDQ